MVTYLVLNVAGRRPLHVRGWTIQLPGPWVSLGQVAVASLDLVVAASVLWVLLPANLNVGYPHVLAGFVLATLVTSVSQVPGGLGVFEVVVALARRCRPSRLPPWARWSCTGWCTTCCPLLTATAVYVVHESRSYHQQLRVVGQGVARWGGSVLPMLLAMLVFICGAVLLFSGAVPPAPADLKWLTGVLPLGSVLETAHLVGSLVGTLLCGALLGPYAPLRLGLAGHVRAGGGGHRRFAPQGTGLGGGHAVGDRAGAAPGVAQGLLPPRVAATRRAHLVVAGGGGDRRGRHGVWLGMFAHKHDDYSGDLWWRVALDQSAPRFLRASLVSVVTMLVVAMLSLHRGARVRHVDPTAEELDAAAAILAQQPSAEALMALVGDKMLLFNDQRTAFVMYDVRGRSWIAMGDPVGPEDQRLALLWKFYELADLHGGMAVFHHVPAGSLPLYLQLGLSPAKIGDLARVPLDEFSFDGPKHRELRQVRNKLERDGYELAIVPTDQVPPILPRLREISDEWLAAKHVAEKRFSVGYFDEGVPRAAADGRECARGGEIQAFGQPAHH